MRGWDPGLPGLRNLREGSWIVCLGKGAIWGRELLRVGGGGWGGAVKGGGSYLRVGGAVKGGGSC